MPVQPWDELISGLLTSLGMGEFGVNYHRVSGPITLVLEKYCGVVTSTVAGGLNLYQSNTEANNQLADHPPMSQEKKKKTMA